MRMLGKTFVAAAIASVALLSTPALAAETLQFNFSALSGPAASFNFTANSSPSPVDALASGFRLNGIDVNFGGTTSSEDLTFWDSSIGGGFSGNQGFVLMFNLFGPQLFTGPYDAPTFLTGSFDLHSQGTAGPLAGTLTISAVSGVPEPATWTLMLVGFGAIGLTTRRRRKSCHAIA